MEKLKDKYLGRRFLRKLATQMSTVYPKLDKDLFYNDISKELDSLELKERLTRITETVRAHLPGDYRKALHVLYSLSETVEPDFGYMFMPQFVGAYGQEEFDISMKALADFTRLSSSEFAVREFIIRDFDRSIKVMLGWARDEDHHIRRLASEGSRPRLPWSFKLQALVRDPSPVRPILEALRADKEKYVQKSVANHINDISKDNQEWVIALLKSWNQDIPQTGWIVKHGLRTLIKNGNGPALKLLGFHDAPKVQVNNLKIAKNKISLGEKLKFSFSIRSLSNATEKLVVDYKIYFVKKSGQLSSKVFKLKNVTLTGGNGVEHFKGERLFEQFSTRKHYSGKHTLEIVINGASFGKALFHLNADNV